MRDAGLASLVGLFVALLTALGEPVAFPLHDAAGRLSPAPAVATIVVRADVSLTELGPLMARSGASEVWAVWPQAVRDVARDGRAVVQRHRGRYISEGRLLPLPEATRGLTRLDATRLSSLPPGFLEGLSVVVVPRDAGADMEQASLNLAVALGAQSTGTWLTELPVLGSATVSGLLAALSCLLLRRQGAVEAVVAGLTGTVIVAVMVLAARVSGVCIPVVGLLGAALVPAATALVRTAHALGWSRPEVVTEVPIMRRETGPSLAPTLPPRRS